VALLIMSVVTFKTGLVSEMFDWQEGGYIYLPSWVREIGSMLQLMPLLIVPFVGVIQTCRYFLHGPDDLFDRFGRWRKSSAPVQKPHCEHALESRPNPREQTAVINPACQTIYSGAP